LRAEAFKTHSAPPNRNDFSTAFDEIWVGAAVLLAKRTRAMAWGSQAD